MRVLFFGDIIGRPGRRALSQKLYQIKNECSADFVIANGENAAGGIGITPAIADEVFTMGIDVLTSGNHIWNKKEIYQYLDSKQRLLRPANYPPGNPGNGMIVLNKDDVELAVMNLCGRVFMDQLDCPFRTADRLLDDISGRTQCVLVDIHAEATSEKLALAWYLDGRVSAVLGTHTHIQTSDERILNKGTAYITDVGMVGPRDSVIGVEVEDIVERFLTLRPVSFNVAKKNIWMDYVVVEIDEESGSSTSICRYSIPLED
ncbi:MAG: TIGR00282 family metallophosphoesterase [Actinobacteria bacterium]|nr:TIGR00282 family metallophosphoesterase [Actinomycetota bacterium]